MTGARASRACSKRWGSSPRKKFSCGNTRRACCSAWGWRRRFCIARKWWCWTSRCPAWIRSGGTVLFSTHVLADAEMLCDRVGVIVGGKLRGVGMPGELMEIKSHGMEILFELPNEPSNFPLLAKAARTGERYRVQLPEAELYDAFDQLKAAGARISSVTQLKPTLEEFFMNLVEADRAQAAAVEVSGK